MRFSPAVVVSFILASSHAMRCCCAASFTARAPINSIIISSGGGTAAAAAGRRRAAAAVTAAAAVANGRRRSSSLLLTHHDPRPTTTNGPLLLHQQQHQQQRQRHIFPTSTLSTQLAFGRTAASAWLPPRGGAAAAAAAASAASSSALYSTTTASATTDTKEGTAEEETKTVIRRQDYQPLPFHTDKVRMTIDIYDQKTIVTTSFHLMKNQEKHTNSSPGDNNEFVLDGDASCVKLLSIARGHGHHGHDDVGGATAAAAVNSDEEVLLHEGVDYTLSKTKLVLNNPHDNAWYTTVVEICPETNTQLAGLYKSGDMYCTQCEANGFRRMTYFPDRPDNMATFERVTIMADAHQYPVLLSNGNRIDSGMVANDKSRHYAIWSDPFPKPSYLFAAVAGNLACRSDVYTTRPSRRRVALNVYSEPSNVHKLDFAMESLKQSMRWDEDRFDLEYDLDLYNIVATNDFNMGAMENKGLNIFNTAYVLADQATATDADFERVQGVIGHEYFHNWTGNRVTCRDWFQLTLKEGLTVFRDQEFSGDLNSKPVNRIENVKALRARQFAEDASPMSHPIRPESYISMDNFYTATVYDKGAEVIRMYQTILNVDGFNKGMKLYFERHDGQAVTCVDFLNAMANANNVDLSQFARWYETPGTPTVTYSSSLNAETNQYSVTLTQSSKSDPLPLHIPISFGLLDKATGAELVPTTVLELKEMTQTFTFDVPASAAAGVGVVPSLLRDFSAPVKLVAAAAAAESDNTAKEKELEDLAFLAAHDTDGFNRWEACQKLATSLIFQTLDEQQKANSNDNVDSESSLLKFVEQAFGRTLAATETTTDYSIQAYALLLPTESTLAEEMDIVDPIGLHKARGTVKKALARKFQNELLERYQQLTADINAETEFKVDATAIGQRRLRNVLLEYLCSIRNTEQEQLDALQLAKNHFDQARGMTDKMASLSALASMHEGPAVVQETRNAALQQFYHEANGDALVLNKWFTIQALADLPDVLDRVKKLTQHPDFSLTNPNRLRSLVGAFGMNSAAFHDASGAGYEFLYDMLSQIDPLNPQVSSRMASNLISWRRYDEARGALMKGQLEKLLSLKNISPNLFEVVNRGLQ